MTSSLRVKIDPMKFLGEPQKISLFDKFFVGLSTHCLDNEDMKKAILKAIGKTILKVSPFLWSLKAKWAFNLHQKLGNIALDLDHAYGLDLWNDNVNEKNPNRF